MLPGEKPRSGGPVEKECRYCICQVCNMEKCHWRSHWNRCLFCLHRSVSDVTRPTLDCDFFTPKYPAHHVYRVVKVRRRRDRIGEILELLKTLTLKAGD